jgi:cytochrome P450
MAIPPSQIILAFVLLCTIYKLAQTLYTKIARHRKARALGCRPPPKAPSGVFGYQAYKSVVQAARASKLLDLFWHLHLENGNTFQRTVLGHTSVVTTEPENIKSILATKFADFSLGNRNKVFFPLLGDGIFTLDGAGWSHSRTMLRPQFSRDQVADVGMLGDHVDQLIALIPRDGAAFDIQELFFSLTLDSATEFLFGESTNSLARGQSSSSSESKGGALANISPDQDFGEAFNRSLEYLASRGRARLLYFLVDDSESRKTIKIIHDIVDYYVDKALARQQQQQQQRKLSLTEEEKLIDSDSSPSSSSSSKYIFLDAMVSETQDRKTLRDQMLHLLLAGRDTTASLLSSCFFYLSRRPDVWHKLRADILSVFPPDETSADETSEITIERIREVRYLKLFLNEVLRLLPPVPLNSRWAVADTVLPTGGGPDGKAPIFVARGDRVMYIVNNMHRRPDLWGEDALDFRPERWEERKRHGWEYLPFNGGPRICLGREFSLSIHSWIVLTGTEQYALTEASYVLVRLLKQFDAVENAQPEIVEPRMSVSLTASHAGGVRVKLSASEK